MKYIQKNHNTLLWFATIASICIAVLYFRVTPYSNLSLPTILTLILTYAHGLCWVFLSTGFLLQTKQCERFRSYAKPALITGGILYAVYLSTYLYAKMTLGQ